MREGFEHGDLFIGLRKPSSPASGGLSLACRALLRSSLPRSAISRARCSQSMLASVLSCASWRSCTARALSAVFRSESAELRAVEASFSICDAENS